MAMVNVKINGADYSVPSDVTVLEACRYANIDIPTLCYLKDVNQIGACRLCLGLNVGPAVLALPGGFLQGVLNGSVAGLAPCLALCQALGLASGLRPFGHGLRRGLDASPGAGQSRGWKACRKAGEAQAKRQQGRACGILESVGLSRTGLSGTSFRQTGLVQTVRA